MELGEGQRCGTGTLAWISLAKGDGGGRSDGGGDSYGCRLHLWTRGWRLEVGLDLRNFSNFD